MGTKTSKLNILIVDDRSADITLIKDMIKSVGIMDYIDNIYECFWVLKNLEEGTDDITLKQFITKNNVHIDIAMVDLYFEKEFPKKVFGREKGGEYATSMIEEAFPDCQIIFPTQYSDGVNSKSTLSKYPNNKYWSKGMSDGDKLLIFKDRIFFAIEEWTKSILFDIKSSESSTQQCLSAFKSDGDIAWDTEIFASNRKWTFENLFFIYKENIEELKEMILSENGLGYLPENLESLLGYYKLLYFKYFKEIPVITTIVKDLLNQLKRTIEDPSEENINNLEGNLQYYSIGRKIPTISTDEDAAFKAFKEKLIIRLFFICAYIIFGEQAKVIYRLFNKAVVTDETVKQISPRLFIRGMLLKESIKKGHLGYKFNDDNESKYVYRCHERNYMQLIEKSCVKYEKDFIIEYYRENQSDLIKIDMANAKAVGEILNLWPPQFNDGKFSWLHISDLHFQEGGDWDTQWLHLCESIKQNDSLRNCSYVFITGDICHKGVFYDVVKERLKQLQESFTLDKKPLFFWSFGNHDISFFNDNNKNKRARKSIIEKVIFIDNSEPYRNFNESIKDFDSQLFSGFEVAKKLAEDSSINIGVKYDKLELNGFFFDKYLNICILNSSVVAIETSKSKQLIVATDDLSNKLSVFDMKRPTFVLAHHPLDWLEDTNAENVGAALSKADIYLCGHAHKASARKISQNNIQSLKEIVAGSASGVWENLTHGARFNIIYGSYDGNGGIDIHCYKYVNYGWYEDQDETSKLLQPIKENNQVVIERLLSK